jgi:hypothetical protein
MQTVKEISGVGIDDNRELAFYVFQILRIGLIIYGFKVIEILVLKGFWPHFREKRMGDHSIHPLIEFKLDSNNQN